MKLLTCKTKEDLSKEDAMLDENQELSDNNDEYIQIGYYLLKLLKCKYDGEVDNSMQYLKLISMAQLKRDTLINYSKVGFFFFLCQSSLSRLLIDKFLFTEVWYK